MKVSEKFFRRYEHIALQYSAKLFNLSTISFDKEDIKQEFRIKLYDIIIAYGQRWDAYLRKEKGKPIPIEFYIRASFNNFVFDYIQEINEKQKTSYVLPDNFESFDIGIKKSGVSNIDFEKGICVINDVDVFKGLSPQSKEIFGLFLEGYEAEEIQQRTKIEHISSINRIIHKQKKFLQPYYADMANKEEQQFFTIKSNED